MAFPGACGKNLRRYCTTPCNGPWAGPEGVRRKAPNDPATLASPGFAVVANPLVAGDEPLFFTLQYTNVTSHSESQEHRSRLCPTPSARCVALLVLISNAPLCQPLLATR